MLRASSRVMTRCHIKQVGVCVCVCVCSITIVKLRGDLVSMGFLLFVTLRY